MDRSSLVIEKPALTQVVLDETDGLLNETNHELADYAATHLGYKRLSSRLYQEKTQRDKKLAVAAQENNLVVALQEADINAYSAKSVATYKQSMVRSGWIKFLLSVEEFNLWISLFFLVPPIAIAAFLLGGLNGWQTVILATVFQLPSSTVLWKELRSLKGGDIIWFPLLFGAPMIGLGLTVGNCGLGWSVITFVFGLLCGPAFLGELFKQLSNTKIYWARVPVGEYNEEIPLFALSKMKQIHQICPSTKFFIEELKADIYLPDPFLVAADPVTGKEFYIEVWDEPKFEAKYT